MKKGTEEAAEAFKDRSRKALSEVFPFDISFQSTVVNGVNFITLDDDWDVPHGLDPKQDIFKFASLDPDPVRFPNFGMTRGERLRTLNARVEDAGWQGAALWVACQ